MAEVTHRTMAPGWLIAARIVFVIATYTTVMCLLTVSFRFGFVPPEWTYPVLPVAYEGGILLGIPLTVVAASVIGVVGGRPRALCFIAGVLVLVGGIAAIVALFS